MTTTRRQFVGGASAALALSGCRHQLLPLQAGAPSPGLPVLRQAAASSGLLVGSAVPVGPLRNSPEFAALLRSQCSILVAENAMKFGPLRPAPDQFFFDDADLIVGFAEKNGMKMRGHNFVWHRQLPNWFAGYATKENAERLLVEHIERVGGRYAGRIHSWDVCNEVIQVKDGQANGLRDSPWLQLLGPGYIDLAFRTARRVDPHALLCYNDYDVEDESPEQAAKRAAVLALLRGMQSRNVPLDGFGVQSHITAGGGHVYGPGLTAFLAELQSMGLRILLTEMDVNDRALPSDDRTRDEAVAALYGSYLQTALANTAVQAVLTWGLTDKYTWLNGEGSRVDHLPERCLPFDENLQPVPAYADEVNALRSAPRRTRN